MFTKAKMVGKRSPFTDQIRSYIKNRCILGIQAKEIFNETKRPLYANIWNRKRLSSFRTLLIRQILPLVTFSYSRGSKKHLAGRKYQTRKNLGSAIFQCLNSIHRKDYENAFENWIKRLKLCVTWWRVFWRIEIKILALFVKRFWKLTQLHSYLNTPHMFFLLICYENNLDRYFVRHLSALWHSLIVHKVKVRVTCISHSSNFAL